ncbi:SCO family protein [Parahaliea maris]|uniref:SCO family protein n=1 Tax=Parahaliea maris TaxID=2716870 RepID=A0A5C8ZTW2_9GAMM|nr:SCO family protein [Parahaliea maris]TXS91239.1 SCO family protein [Parahaliea maris]
MTNVGAALLGMLLLVAGAHASTGATVLAPGYGQLAFTPPAAGSYSLPALGDAVDGRVLDRDARQWHLHDVLDGKLVLMGFIYTHCPDVNGCPLASYVMKQVQERLVNDAQLRDQVRLISLSFDPDLDTPEAMKAYSRHFRREDFDWRFLTTNSETDLLPILQGYGQFRQKVYDEDGSYAGSMSHLLRVYLIDRDKQIRNIYSAGFLHADTVVNDLRTLLLTQD